MTDAGGFLQEFKQQKRWLLWREETCKGKPTKVPYSVTGALGSSTNPETWAWYNAVLATSKRYDGVGFAMGDGNVLIDLDGCRNRETGAIEEWAKFVMDFLNLPAEVSPSGTGVHLYAHSNLTTPLKRMFNLPGEPKKGIEIYPGGRYSTISFAHIPGTPTNVPEVDLTQFVGFVREGDFDPPEYTARKPTESTPLPKVGPPALPALDLKKWIMEHGVEILRQKPDGTYLIPCPGTHGDYDKRDGHAFLKQLSSGALTMGCLHQSCSLSNGSNRWAEFRAMVEGPRAERQKNLETDPLIAAIKPAKKKLAAHKVANWQTCAEVKPETLVFLWPQRVPLKFGTAFLGDPDMGKSLMSLDFMARLSRGKAFLDGSENPHGVVESILLSTEDDPNTIIIPRLMAAGADLSKIHLVDTVRMFDAEEELEEERQLTLESDLAVIRQKIECNPAIKLLAIDPLSNYLGSRNLMKEQEVRSVLMPVVAMAQDLSIAVIVIMHHSKTEGRSAMHKAIGAVGAVGCLRMAWSFVKSQDDENIREMLQSKKNLGKFPGLRFATESTKVRIGAGDTEQARIQYLDVSNASIESILAAQEDKEGRKDKRAIAFLKENLPKDGTHHSAPIIDKAREDHGISKDALLRARKELGINTEKIANQWFWSWPSN